ncbi:Crp/Fnr family transcriptional regulator [Spongiibacter sp. KMU-158]|uniref:Crp/Fnr family transcriptional regulator n=1 Tax=Spongiibacter pelagi TaxID=2760804 RepID=A0A927C2N7_9GAMM|nr:Crp/Fnr family transcriptional regulator [Spongiibacter pelagi]MBD2858666.1 Crp/Fnr family transcriptional regulator [Spongiibacter pelagi]
MSNKRDILLGSPLLAGLPETAIEPLLEVAKLKKLVDGQLLYSQGEAGEAMYGVLSGSIRLYNRSEQGRELLVMQVERGDWIGEVSLFDGLPRSHDACAQGPCEVLVLAKADLDALLEKEPAMYRHFIPMLCRKLRMALSYVENVALYSLPERLARRLLELTEFYGEDDGEQGLRITLHLPQEDLAKMLAVTRQAVSRELKRLESEGLIRLAYGKLWVLDQAGLQKLAK